MNKRWMGVLVGWAVPALLGAGCASTQQVYRTSAEAIQSARQSAAQSVAASGAVGVSVNVVGGQPDAERLGPAMAQSIADDVTAAGRPAQMLARGEQASAYLLTCTVSDAGVRQTHRWPDRLTYELTGECTFSHGTQQLWQGAVAQRYNEEIVVNTMSRLPKVYEAAWLRECWLPWRRMVAWRTVHAMERQEANAATPAAAGPAGAGASSPAGESSGATASAGAFTK